MESATEGPQIERVNSMGNRLYVGNLPFSATTDTLRQAFASSGEVTDVHVVTDRETGRSRGFGFVTMAHAIANMNGADMDGRALRVNEAEERPQRSGGGGFGGGGGGGGGRGGGGYGGGGGGGRGGGDRRNKW
jgi:RNA recognition motif-containing protein